MKIKYGTVRKDVTAFGNKYWIQIQDSIYDDNSDMEALIGEDVAVVIDVLKNTSVASAVNQ